MRTVWLKGVAWIESRECRGDEVEVGMSQGNYPDIWSLEQAGNYVYRLLWHY